MKRFMLTAAVVLAGCNNVEVGLVVEEVPPPDDQCGFEPGNIEYPLTFDTQRMTQMFVPTEVTNLLSDDGTRLAPSDPAAIIEFPLSVTPTRFDFRWECDSTGFSAGRGPLILPAFSVDRPFCLDTRDDGGDFVGFDEVSASGASISPGNTGIWLFIGVPAELGDAMNVAFQLAELSERCCEEVGGCQNATMFATGGDCEALDELIQDISQGQRTLREEGTIDIWRPYYIFTAASAAEVGRGNIPDFKMRMRGVYEGITASGSLVTSTEFVRDIGFCKGAPFGAGERCTLALTEFCFDGFVDP